jgi:hypothetical protein
MLPTYEKQLELVSKGLAVKKTEGIFDTFKYHRNVMFKNLWGSDPALLDCRGHVYDNRNGKLVQAAPRKSFNYLENNHWRDTSPDQPVILYKKYNGFMACASYYEGNLVVSTTGTTNSDYAKLARYQIDQRVNRLSLDSHSTGVFEIVHESDPHIVSEVPGVYTLGWRFKDDGTWLPVADIHKPKEMTRAEALAFVQKDKGEGYMMYKLTEDGVDTTDVCKLKTPYYIGKKKLMRMSTANVLKLYSGNRQDIPEIWDNLVIEIVKRITQEEWLYLDAQMRRQFIEQLEPDYLEI